MNHNLYQKNVFLQKAKTKHNPDVLKKKQVEDKTRIQSVFRASNVTYNSITNNVPSNIKTQKDLELEKDKTINNIEQTIAQKKKEREDQDRNNKPIKQKVLIESGIDNTFTDLKETQTVFVETQKKNIENDKNKFDSIMKNLKELGIINK
jgi:hypothetical protein